MDPKPIPALPNTAFVEPPEYHDAVAHENFVRGHACLGFPESISGLEVLPLNAWHIRWLSLVRCPFLINGVTLEQLAGKPGIVEDILNFFWIVSPLFRPGAVTSKHWPRLSRRDRFNERYAGLMTLPIDQVISGILKYIDDAMLDAGEPSIGGSDKSYYATEIGIAHELHEAYGYAINIWDRPSWFARLLVWAGIKLPNPSRVPLKNIFQLRKLRAKWNDSKAVITNRSEKILSEELARLNAAQRLEMRIREYENELLNEKPVTQVTMAPVDVDYENN